MITMQKKIKTLLEKGTKIPLPETVFIGPEVDIGRISGNNVTILPGCRISGKSTLILDGAVLGEETPAIVSECQVGINTRIKGGFFQKSVFLGNNAIGSGAHVRSGTILEEYAKCAHTAGLKQTVLFPFVTLGSLINFCDCLMAGGTSRKNHSEVGSGYIHFNYTPNQDKATPSLLGDVPCGVMLDQRPIFLGGQGGIVGPGRLAYGTVTGAGSIIRKDELRPGRLLVSAVKSDMNVPCKPGRYPNINRIILNNLIYIGNLIALENWYRYVRYQFVSKMLPDSLLEGLMDTVSYDISERIGYLEKLCRNVLDVPISDYLFEKKEADYQGKMLAELLKNVDAAIQNDGNDYIRVIQHLPDSAKKNGTNWLQGIVDKVVSGALPLFPSLNILYPGKGENK